MGFSLTTYSFKITKDRLVLIAITEGQDVKSKQEMTSRHFKWRPNSVNLSDINTIGHLALQCSKNPVIRCKQTKY